MTPGRCIASLNGRGQCTRSIHDRHVWHLTKDGWLWTTESRWFGKPQYAPPKRILDRIRRLFKVWDGAK